MLFSWCATNIAQAPQGKSSCSIGDWPETAIECLFPRFFCSIEFEGALVALAGRRGYWTVSRRAAAVLKRVSTSDADLKMFIDGAFEHRVRTCDALAWFRPPER